VNTRLVEEGHNPSIEGTCHGRLCLPRNAAHVERSNSSLIPSTHAFRDVFHQTTDCCIGFPLLVSSRIVPRRTRPLWSRRFPGRAVEFVEDFDESPQGRSRSVKREIVGNGTGTREEEATRTFL
jgi:hypothetical protein